MMAGSGFRTPSSQLVGSQGSQGYRPPPPSSPMGWVPGLALP